MFMICLEVEVAHQKMWKQKRRQLIFKAGSGSSLLFTLEVKVVDL